MKRGKPIITVFGGSKPVPGDPAYFDAQLLGQQLAEAGYSVQTGGYIGIMEAVSRGAAEAGGHVIGITCEEIEKWRPVGPNPWVIEEIRFPTLKERLYALMTNCDAAIALPGGIGTLQEIVVMWAQLQIGAIDPKPLVLVGQDWENTFLSFFENLGAYIPRSDKAWLKFSIDVVKTILLITTLVPVKNHT